MIKFSDFLHDEPEMFLSVHFAFSRDRRNFELYLGTKLNKATNKLSK